MSMTARTQLRRWMERAKLNQVAAAEVIGIPYYMFNKIVIGSRLPGRNSAVKIEQKTGIPVRAWSSIRLDESATATGTHGGK